MIQKHEIHVMSKRRTQILVSFKLYLFKRTAENEEETYGRVFKGSKHLEDKRAMWTQQADSSDSLGVKQSSNFQFLFTWLIGTVNTAISRHLTVEHNVQMRKETHCNSPLGLCQQNMFLSHQL